MPAIPYCIDLIEGPYLETDPAVIVAFRPGQKPKGLNATRPRRNPACAQGLHAGTRVQSASRSAIIRPERRSRRR